jgi:hypothetical protein
VHPELTVNRSDEAQLRDQLGREGEGKAVVEQPVYELTRGIDQELRLGLCHRFLSDNHLDASVQADIACHQTVTFMSVSTSRAA